MCVKMYVYVERMSLCVYASGVCVCVRERERDRERQRENECVYLSVMFPKFTTNVFRIVVSPLFSLKQISSPHSKKDEIKLTKIFSPGGVLFEAA